MSESLPLKSVVGYLKPEDIQQVEAAFEFSRAAHKGQFRKSGEPYIHHPVAVTCLLAEWHLDARALMAALLHDVVEDTLTTPAEIAEKFGKEVADLVDGVSKLDKIEFQSAAQAQAENFRKMLLAMARDIRVILIKLADRLHNMRTMDSMRPDKQKRIARETLEIYAPIANRLGLNRIYQELDDLAFRYLYPNRYQVLDKAVKKERGNRKEVINKILEAIQQRLSTCRVEATVTGREKHLYSIYRKMHDKSLAFSEVFDIYGFRVIVPDIPSCYLALGALHQLYKPIPGKFKDYIAIPKANGYQSLHTTLFGPFGTPVEVQIRTQEMHKLAEAGVAAHWLYKASETSLNEVQQKTHQWLQSLVEMQSETGDSVEFLEHLKVDLFPDEVYVFTPKGKIMALPRGSTAVDFAYAVHTDIGDRTIAAKINYEPAPLRTPLRNGDQVEIITAPQAKPNPSWLHFVITGKARTRIRHFLRTMQFDESVSLGERLLCQAFKGMQIDPKEQITAAHWEHLIQHISAKSREEVLADIGLGKRLGIVVARQLLSPLGSDGEHHAPPPTVGPVTIRGSEGMAVQFGRCCSPIPGDPIMGFINKDHGLVIHTHDCPTVSSFRNHPERWMDVSWAPEIDRLFDVGIKMVVANERGVLAKVAASISESDSNIGRIHMEEDEGSAYTSLYFTLQVRNRVHLATLMRHLRKIPEVVRINRVKHH